MVNDVFDLLGVATNMPPIMTVYAKFISERPRHDDNVIFVMQIRKPYFTTSRAYASSDLPLKLKISAFENDDSFIATNVVFLVSLESFFITIAPSKLALSLPLANVPIPTISANEKACWFVVIQILNTATSITALGSTQTTVVQHKGIRDFGLLFLFFGFGGFCCGQ